MSWGVQWVGAVGVSPGTCVFTCYKDMHTGDGDLRPVPLRPLPAQSCPACLQGGHTCPQEHPARDSDTTRFSPSVSLASFCCSSMS